MARDITKLHPTLQAKIKQLQDACTKAGLKIGIGECTRTIAEQDALYAQGRTKPGNKVTNAKGSSYSSMHQWGVAFDFYRNDGKGTYEDKDKFFSKVGKIGVGLGLEWGGNWKSPVDKPHFQLPDWGSTPAKLKSTYKTPTAFKKTWPTSTSTTIKTTTKASTTTKTKTTKTTTPAKPTTTTNSAYVADGVDYSPVFNSAYYANHNSDVKAALGGNSALLFKHFCQNGMKEKRQAIATFNVVKYKAKYPDLEKAFKNDWPSYYKHYCMTGMKEGRSGV